MEKVSTVEMHRAQSTENHSISFSEVHLKKAHHNASKNTNEIVRGTDEMRFTPGRVRDKDIKDYRDERRRNRAKIIGVALELERKSHPLFADSNASKELSFYKDNGKAILRKSLGRMSDMLNGALSESAEKENNRLGGNVYDMILIDKNGDEEEEDQKDLERKRLQEIQEQRRTRVIHDNEEHGILNMGEYTYLLPIEWMLDDGGVPCM